MRRALILLAVTACASPTRIQGPGFSVPIPSGWELGRAEEFGATGGESPAFTQALAPPDADEATLILIEAYDLDAPPGPDAEEQVNAAVGDLAAALHAEIVDGPRQGSLGPLPAFEFHLDSTDALGRRLTSRLVFAFRGATEYYVNCQWTAQHAEALTEGCDRILSNFALR